VRSGLSRRSATLAKGVSLPEILTAFVRIAVLGAGAIGSVLGGLLAREGHEVTLVGRRESVEAIRARGLRMEGCLGSLELPVHAATSLGFAPDLALLAVKTQDVQAAVREHRGELREVPLVTLQNGVRSDALVAAALPGADVISGVVVVTATYLEPGKVTLVDRGHLVIGRPNGSHDGVVDRVASVLDPAVPTRISDHIAGAHWLKLLLNLNNALPALTNLSLREVSEDPYLRGLAVRLMREGRRVIDRAGISLESLGDVSAAQVRLLTRLPTWWAARLFARQATRLGGPWPVLGSTLQSLRRGRATEIDFLNGEIVALGRDVHVHAPLNEHVVGLVHDLERTRMFYTPAVLRAALENVA
jgi:2-dehydropantoate 2-reductase